MGKRHQIVEEQAWQAKKSLDDAELGVKELRMQILQQKTTHEETLQKIDNEIREDNDQKFNLAVRNLEQKLNVIEENRDQLQKKQH